MEPPWSASEATMQSPRGRGASSWGAALAFLLLLGVAAPSREHLWSSSLVGEVSWSWSRRQCEVTMESPHGEGGRGAQRSTKTI